MDDVGRNTLGDDFSINISYISRQDQFAAGHHGVFLPEFSWFRIWAWIRGLGVQSSEIGSFSFLIGQMIPTTGRTI